LYKPPSQVVCIERKSALQAASKVKIQDWGNVATPIMLPNEDNAHLLLSSDPHFHSIKFVDPSTALPCVETVQLKKAEVNENILWEDGVF
jgi:hypothetical protein